MEVEQLKAQLEILHQERNVLAKRASLADLYETTLKLQLGHIVELLAAGAAWRESKGGLMQTERLQRAIDAAQGEEARRAAFKSCKVHHFVNDVCKDCGERDD